MQCLKDLLRFSILARELWTAVNHNYDHKQRALKERNTKRIEIHQSQNMNFELVEINPPFPKRSAKVIDSSEERKR